MKLLKNFLLLSTMLVSAPSFAQMVEDPTSWTYEVKKKNAADYQLIFHLSLKPKWHIWSLNPGGDGLQIVPSFTLDKNDKVKVKGKVAEIGKPTTVTMDGIDGKVTYLSNKVDYVLDITVAGNTKITGKHEYQTCSDKLCLAPKTKNFSVDIK